MRVIFIDNGTTGSIGYYDGTDAEFILTPAKKEQDYTKKKKEISRIDTGVLMRILREMASGHRDKGQLWVYMERPMINPTRFAASITAARAFEATLSVLEVMSLPRMFVDSKDWQKSILPSSGKKGTDSATLKKESMDIGMRMFPQFEELIRKHKDADGILGAYALYRKES